MRTSEYTGLYLGRKEYTLHIHSVRGSLMILGGWLLILAVEVQAQSASLSMQTFPLGHGSHYKKVAYTHQQQKQWRGTRGESQHS